MADALPAKYPYCKGSGNTLCVGLGIAHEETKAQIATAGRKHFLIFLYRLSGCNGGDEPEFKEGRYRRFGTSTCSAFFSSRRATEDGVSKDGECDNVQPKNESAYHDHSIIALGLGNLLRFLPIHPECNTNIRSRRESSPVASAIWTYRKQPDQRSYE